MASRVTHPPSAALFCLVHVFRSGHCFGKGARTSLTELRSTVCVCWGSWLMLLEGWKDGWVDGEMDGGRMSDPGPVEGYENSKTQREKNNRGFNGTFHHPP